MRKIVLYGAGKRGVKAVELLGEKGIEVHAFCDSYKKGEIKLDRGGVIPVYPIEKLKKNKEEYIVIVTIKDPDENMQMRELLEQYGIEISSMERVIFQNTDIVEGNRKYVADWHEDSMEKYYEDAELRCNMKIFWSKQSVFYQMFSKMDVQNIVELACGRGRHVPWYVNKADNITLVDILAKNIEYCRERFEGESKIEYYNNSGHDLNKLKTEGYTALFTYDAMVHFELIDIFEYLRETKRILKKGGRALFHHSNNTQDYRITFFTGVNGRNYMSKDIFAHLVDRAGLKVLEQHVISWGGIEKLDCVTLVEKL